MRRLRKNIYLLTYLLTYSNCKIENNICFAGCIWRVTVTVTEALVLRRLLEDRGRIESIRILVPVDRMKQKCCQITA